MDSAAHVSLPVELWTIITRSVITPGHAMYHDCVDPCVYSRLALTAKCFSKINTKRMFVRRFTLADCSYMWDPSAMAEDIL